MLQKLRFLAISLSLLAVYAQAHADVITVDNLSVTSANVGLTSQTTPYSYLAQYSNYFVTNYSNTTHLETELVEHPTTTASGLEKIYEVNTVKYNDNVTTYKRDNLLLGVTAADSGPAGSKYLTLSGSVTSSIATTIYFDLTAVGTYVPGSSPFGSAVPALASLYLGETLATVTPSTSHSAYTDSVLNSYWVNSNYNYAISIAAGQTVAFSAAIFAPNDASLNQLQLHLLTDAYGYQTVTTPYEYATRTLVDARIVPPLPVPENTTYAMLLAGLGMIGMVRSRRRQGGQP